jgi:hypothetical protein
MTGLDRLARLPDADFVKLWNSAAAIDEVVARVVERVGHVPRWAVVARAVALRKAGQTVTALGPPTSSSASSPAA